jgi:hypothetical protein
MGLCKEHCIPGQVQLAPELHLLEEPVRHPAAAAPAAAAPDQMTVSQHSKSPPPSSLFCYLYIKALYLRHKLTAASFTLLQEYKILQ